MGKHNQKKAEYSKKAYAAGRRAEKKAKSNDDKCDNNSGPSAGVYATSCVLGPVGPMLVWFGWGK